MLTDERTEIEKLIDKILIDDALIVLNLDRGAATIVQDWTPAQMDAHYKLRESGVKAIQAFADAAYTKALKEVGEKMDSPDLKHKLREILRVVNSIRDFGYGTAYNEYVDQILALLRGEMPEETP